MVESEEELLRRKKREASARGFYPVFTDGCKRLKNF